MENKMTKGIILGGILMATAVAIFSMTKEGKELTKKLKEEAVKMSTNIKDDLGKFRDVTKEDFEELVTTLVDEYAKKKELGEDSKNKIGKFLKSKWNDIKEDFAKET